MSSFPLFVCACVLLLSLEPGGGASNTGGAIHARVTGNGFELINKVLKKLIDDKLKTFTIPNLDGKSGRTNYKISNMRIASFVQGETKITPTSAGLRWLLSFREIKVTGNWWFRYKRGWFKISDDGSFRVSVKNLKFDVYIKPQALNGKLVVLSASTIPLNCASIADVDVHIGGSFWSWLYNLFKGKIERKMRDKVPPKVCEAAGKALNSFSSSVFPYMKTSDVLEILDKKFLADYGLLDPVFENGRMNVRFKGEVVPQPNNIGSIPFSPSPLPPTPTEKDVYLVISDYVANSLLYAIQKKGLGSTAYSLQDVKRSSDISQVLGDFCSGEESCELEKLELRTELKEAPKMTFSKRRGVTLAMKKAVFKVGLKNGNDFNSFVEVEMEIKVSASPTLSSDGTRLSFRFSSPDVAFDVIRPQLPPAKERQIQNLVRLAGARWGLIALNKFGVKGLELPNVKGRVGIMDRELTTEDGALVLGANLSYQGITRATTTRPTTPRRCPTGIMAWCEPMPGCPRGPRPRPGMQCP